MPRESRRPAQQIQNVGADRYVEHRHGFVGDEQLGLQDQRARDHHALPLPPIVHTETGDSNLQRDAALLLPTPS